MPFFPPLTAMFSSASTDLAKTWLGRKGWPRIFTFLRQHNIMPTSDQGKISSSLALILGNSLVDWHHGEETPLQRFTKDVLKDVPSEYMERIWGATASAANPRSHNPIFDLTPEERAKFLTLMRSLDPSNQNRLRELVNELDAETLKTLAAADAADLATLLDLLMPAAPPKTDHPSLGSHINDRLEAVANFLVPRLGRS